MSEDEDTKASDPQVGSGSTPREEGEALRRLEARLDRATGAAERLLAEAAKAGAASAGHVADAAARAADAAARSGGEAGPGGGEAGPGGGEAGHDAGAKPPPAGWQEPTPDTPTEGSDVEVLTQFLRSLRDLVPPELQRRLAEALRELLLALRAVIDWYLERAEKRRREPPEVRDIPIG